MEREQRKKNIIKKVIADLKTEKNGFCRITHKKGWLGFLEDGDLIFTPCELHQVLQRIIKEHPPRGQKLFCLRKRYCFTVTDERKPGKPEEALERFIVASNPAIFYNQIPIGGGKESIDIGIQESDENFIFVELKPFKSTNTPLYAIVESLKNLMEYRFMFENPDKYKGIPRYKVALIVLAPQSYWDDYRVSESGTLQKMKKLLNELSVEFKTNISLMALHIVKDEFFDTCRKICEQRGIDKKQRITISEADAILKLARNQWTLLVASDKLSTQN